MDITNFVRLLGAILIDRYSREGTRDWGRSSHYKFLMDGMCDSGDRGRSSYYKLLMDGMCDRENMPRKARIDASGALHHIIARGIDRKRYSLKA